MEENLGSQYLAAVSKTTETADGSNTPDPRGKAVTRRWALTPAWLSHRLAGAHVGRGAPEETGIDSAPRVGCAFLGVATEQIWGLSVVVDHVSWKVGSKQGYLGAHTQPPPTHPSVC